jgi:hypothetical protein
VGLIVLGKTSGVPAFVILHAGGKVLDDSGDGDKNIGFPYQPHEIEHYFATLKSTCPNLSKADVNLLREKLKKVRSKLD